MAVPDKSDASQFVRAGKLTMSISHCREKSLDTSVAAGYGQQAGSPQAF